MGGFDGSAGAGVGVLDGSAGAGVVERGSAALLDVKFGCKSWVVCLARGVGVGVGGLVWGAEAGAGFVRAERVLDGEGGVFNPSAELVCTPSLPECA